MSRTRRHSCACRASWSAACGRRAVQSSGLVTSARTARPRRPSASTSPRVCARRSSRRAPSTTSAPAWARALANWTPSPLDAPVTIATRPSRRKLSSTGIIRSPLHGHARQDRRHTQRVAGGDSSRPAARSGLSQFRAGRSIASWRDGRGPGRPDRGRSRNQPFYVLTRRVAKRWIGIVAEARRGRLLVRGALLDPVVPVLPPAAGVVDRAREPLGGIGAPDRSGAVAGPRAARPLGYHNRVAAPREDERRVAADHGDGPIAVLPW